MRRVIFWIGVAIILFVFIFPIAWIFVTSFKGRADIMVPTRFFFIPTLENYAYEFGKMPLLKEMKNSAIVTLLSTAFVMAVSLPAGYSFARFNTGGGHLLFITISTRMFPVAVAAIPFFLVYKSLGWLDTRIGLTLLFFYFNMSFAVFLLFGFFREIPEELEHAAMVDGYGRLTILRKVVFPLIKPGAAITAVFCLVFAWNEFLFAFLFTRIHARTISVGLTTFWGSMKIQWGPMAAGAGLAILPTLIACWFMQRYIIRGLTFGAVKG
ncbi:MAG: carbohydrate ABC transporter permease [Desulfobacteraceae bacterium]|nr:carbohydrate ABC transporter permease [Desulfobacteraceae bacterium]